MKIYKIVRQDLDYQLATTDPPHELLHKDLYQKINIDVLDCFERDKKKKLTDVLKEGTFSLLGVIASSKFCNILQSFNLKDVQFVPVKIPDLNEYFFVFINSDLTHYIDYDKTRFQIVEDFLGDITNLNIEFSNTRSGVIKAYKEYCAGKVMVKMVPDDQIYFLEGMDISVFNIFRLGDFDKSFYASEEVKNAMEQNKITGIDFFETRLFKW